MHDDIYLSFSWQSKSVYSYMNPGEYYMPPDNTRAMLEVFGEYYVKVTADVGPLATKEIIFDCLYGAMKHIDDQHFLSLVRSKIRTQIGVEIDDKVSKEIAVASKITGSTGTSYEIILKAPIGLDGVQVNFYTNYDNACIQVSTKNMGYLSQYPVPFATMEFEPDMVLDGYVHAFHNMYNDFPEHSHIFAQAKNDFHTKLGEIVVGKIKPLHSGSSMKDSRVDKLPGHDAMVKHPINGSMKTLFSIIIDLNDKYKWTREAIADWLDSLDVDLEFK